ncbi:MAG: hypoxanthine phosphoribosyltransferase [Pseudomonadales bacterium]|nr:hypoxanthine phosphoribosyltransferase [Pseudomonadales bacterium]
MKKFDHGIIDVLVAEDQIKQRIADMGKQLTADYADIDAPLIVVVLMKGAFVFAADLVREIQLPLHMDFMIVSSYGDKTESSREVRIIKDLQEAIHDRHVLLVDDIIDTGLTFKKIVDLLQGRNPRSLKTCTLLDKSGRRETDLDVDYFGFHIPNKFVVGYGLDYAQSYRNLPYIGILDPGAE